MKKALRVLALFVVAWAVLSCTLAPRLFSFTASADGPITVKLDVDEDSFSGMSHREKLDQVRDWLLLTAMSAAGTPPERIAEFTFDLPAIRHRYMRPVGNFQYGVARSSRISDEEVVALIPAGATEVEAADLVAQIADEHRKNSGDAPGKLRLFEYQIDLANRAAQLIRRETVGAQEIFSSTYGYTESSVSSLAELTRFMSGVDEVTFARLNQGGGGITLGGRKFKAPGRRGLRVEDVAALWQAEAKIAQREQSRSDLIRRAEEFDSRWERTWRDFDARWRPFYDRLVTTEVLNQHKKEKAQLEAREKKERAGLLAEMRAAGQSPQLVTGSGFSLDPEYDFQGLLRFFDEALGPVLRELAQAKAGSFTLGEVSGVRKGLAGRDINPFMRLLGKLVASGDKELAGLIAALLKEGFSFQKARYDGDLQGTEVGMVLFYTDLLAKLWAMDYMETAPTSSVKDFRPIVGLPTSPIYRRETEELTKSRLWFGPREEGFQVAADGQTLLLGHTATRVYSASSDPFNPGVETAAAAPTAAFLGWWDDHYEEIARYEPEYERLDAIMKWSLLIGWLNNEGQGNLLGFLRDVQVNRANWFPTWASQQPELKFSNWGEIGFFERGFKGTTTETLPVLFSKPFFRFGQEWSLAGGVSLANKVALRHRVARARAGREVNVSRGLRRADVTPVRPEGNPNSLVMQAGDGTTYRLAESAPGSKTISVTAKPAARLRGQTGELSNVPLRQTTSAEPGGFKVEVGAEEVALGQLDIKRSESVFRIGWQSRDVDAGQALARRLSRHPEPETMLALDPQVEAAYRLGKEGPYLVKMKNSDRWMKVTEGGEPPTLHDGGGGGQGGPPRPPLKAAVADPGGNSRRYELVWLDTESVKRDLSKTGYIEVQTVEREVLTGKTFSLGMRLQARAGEPPRSATPVKITGGPEVISATVDPATGTMYLKLRELPASMKNDPALLGTWLQPSDVQSVARLAKSARMGVEYVKTVAPADGLTSGVALGQQLIEAGRYPEAVRHLSALIKAHEQVPELKVLRAIARLKQGRAQTATEELNALANQPGRDPALFFNEVNSRLKSFYGSDEVYYAEYGKRYDLHRRVNNPGEPEDGIPLDADVYVQDSPELLGMDWSPSVTPGTLNEIISGGLGRGSSLPPGGASTFRPTVIYDEGGGARYVLKSSVRPGTPARGQPGIRGYRPISGCYDDEDEGEETECEEALQERPVFLITDTRRSRP